MCALLPIGIIVFHRAQRVSCFYEYVLLLTGILHGKNNFKKVIELRYKYLGIINVIIKNMIL